MNISELARQLKVSPQELYDLLPEFGFDIGRRAIKVDDRVAAMILSVWPAKYRAWLEKQRQTKVEEKGAVPASELIPSKKVIPLPSAITVRELAAQLNVPVTTLMSELIKNGILASINERIDYETASVIASDFGFMAEPIKTEEGAEILTASIDKLKTSLEGEAKENLVSRPPVVVVMGHVDHGKTTLLDAIRATEVAKREAGGITQHIGAYQVTVRPKGEAPLDLKGIPRSARDDLSSQGRQITFIDTPGHEAFSVMRSRGAKVADIAILVVAADDGVQPQTKEAARIIQAAKLPFVVAINKIDKPGADAQRIKTQLSELGLIPEDWGGKTICVPVSAKTKAGLDQLLEMVILVADLEKENIVANPKRLAIGTVIDSHIDKGAGAVATVLVQNGTLRLNEYLAVGNLLYGKVRAMQNWQGEPVSEATPGMPVKIIGFKASPAVGDILEVPADTRGLEKKIRGAFITEKMAPSVAPTSEQETAVAEKKMLNVIIRADALGSLEAILGAIEKLTHPEVGITVIAKGLGSISESEVTRALASSGIVYGFNVPVLGAAALLAQEKGVVVRQYKIIYDLFDDIKKELQKIVPQEIIIEEIGKLEVLAIFRSEKNYAIIGGRVMEGRIASDLRFRIIRNKENIGEGIVEGLQLGKNDVKEVVSGQECGLRVKTKINLEAGDRLEFYKQEVKEKRIVFGI